MTTLKRKYIIYLAALMVLMSAAACSKILEQQPKNSTYLQQFWKSANDCEYAIAGNYALLR
ncbi:MAG TPA: RagB/SusD family nutrient uptake outer membrane protein, partial [Puia sp.]